MTFSAPPHGPMSPWSPVLFAGIAARPLPQFVLQPLLDAAVRQIHRRHPDVFARLSGLDTAVFVIDPVDLPWVVVLQADTQRPRMRLAESAADIPHTAAMRGAAAAFLALLEGTRDGDALFFSRELVIDGDTEAVVALRNALDDAEIDVAGDLLSAFGPLAGPLRRIVDRMQRNLAQVSATLTLIHDALVGPTRRAVAHQQQDLAALHGRLDALEAAAGRAHRARGDAGTARGTS